MAAPKSPHEMFRTMKGNIEEKTGRSFEAWVGLARKSGITTFKALTDHMKTEHGMTHGYAQLVSWGVIDPARLEAGNEDVGMVDELYSGKKADLRPIYDKLISVGRELGSDVEQVICKTYTSLRAKSQFAIVAPRTNGAVDLELALPPGITESDRLQPFKSSYPKFTHRIRITDERDVDDEVKAVLSAAHTANVS